MDITGALSSLKAISELVTTVAKGKTDDAVKEKAIELNQVIASLQSTIFSLHTQCQQLRDEKEAIKKELMDMRNWEQEASRYELTELCPGVLVYSIKPEAQGTEPPHQLCPNCYQNRRKAILQKAFQDTEGTVFKCHDCGSSICNHSDKLPFNAEIPSSSDIWKG